jgi:hypothetical protein
MTGAINYVDGVTVSLLCCAFSGETANSNYIIFWLTRLGQNPQYTSLETSKVTVTPPT